MKDKINPSPYMLIYDMPSATDGYGVESIEQGISSIEDTYIEWLIQTCDEMKGKTVTEFIEEWNYTIENFCCWIAPLQGTDEDGEPDYYDDSMDSYTFLSDDNCKEIGWISWDKIPKDVQDEYIKAYELIDDRKENN